MKTFLALIAALIIAWGCSKNSPTSSNLAANQPQDSTPAKIIKSQVLYQILDTIQYFDTITNTYKDSIRDSLLCTWYYDSNGTFISRSNSGQSFSDSGISILKNNMMAFIPVIKDTAEFYLCDTLTFSFNTDNWTRQQYFYPDSFKYIGYLYTVARGDTIRDTAYSNASFVFDDQGKTNYASMIASRTGHLAPIGWTEEEIANYAIRNTYW
jgi:hypothetical protein